MPGNGQSQYQSPENKFAFRDGSNVLSRPGTFHERCLRGASVSYMSYRPVLTSLQVETTLEPLELLDALQSIEIGLGRKKLVDKGPRSIDLDILLYDQHVVTHERLNIPHKLMLERDFVLRPLSQSVPNSSSIDKQTNAHIPDSSLTRFLPSQATKQATSLTSKPFPHQTLLPSQQPTSPPSFHPSMRTPLTAVHT